MYYANDEDKNINLFNSNLSTMKFPAPASGKGTNKNLFRKQDNCSTSAFNSGRNLSNRVMNIITPATILPYQNAQSTGSR